MHEISLEEAASRLAELIQKAREGGEVILTEGGQPVAKLVALQPPRVQRRFGSMKGKLTIADDFDEPLADLADYQ